MLRKIVQNDLINSKLVSLTIFAFIMFASFLLSTVAMIAVNLSSSVNLFLENAKAPHFLQMHMGELDQDRMTDFAQNNDLVLDYQTLPFLNLDSSDIIVNGQRFSENSQDNGFSYQSQRFDFLLDLDDQVIVPKEGEIYIPLVYYTNGVLKTGDEIRISGQKFLVKGPIRDAQMSSMLASSKRFLIHPKDYEQIKPLGREEYLIEFLLKDPRSLDVFQGDYAKAGLESNGPTITYVIIRLINALTDGIMVAILFLVSFLTVLVSLLCIRLTLLSKIEDEYKTIGVLRAIGMRLSLIKKMYLTKYVLVAFFASLLGLAISFALSKFFLENIRLYFGENESALPAMISAWAASILIFLVILFYIDHFLNRLRDTSPAAAINRGMVTDEASNLKHFKLRQQVFLSINLFLALNSILTRKKTYFTFVFILITASFLMVLPNNIYASLASDEFIRYMGLGKGQVMMVFPDGEYFKHLKEQVKNDLEVEDVSFYDHKSYAFMLDETQTGKIWVTLAGEDHFPPLYTQGRPPQAGEIAISALKAESLGKRLGDQMTLIVDQKKEDLTISGIYSDITNGGKTARASFSDDQSPSLMTSLVMNLKTGVSLEEKVAFLEKAYPNAKVYDIKAYRDAVFDSTLSSIRKASITAALLSLGLGFLITLLFVNMLVIKDRRQIAILKFLGFTSESIRNIYMLGSLFIVSICIVLGIILAGTLGQSLAGLFIQGVGIAHFKFDVNKAFVFFIMPILLMASVFIGTYLSACSIAHMKPSDHIRG